MRRRESIMTLAEIVTQLESCEFECEAGSLTHNVAFIALKNMLPKIGEAEIAVEERLVSEFADRLKKLANEIMGQLETDYLPYIETNLIFNERQETISAIIQKWQGPHNRYVINPSEAQKIRARILEEHRDEIVSELNQDNLAEIERLKKDLEWHRQEAQRRVSMGY
jgi:hypothetical protein